jgi:hypothetical protein
MRIPNASFKYPDPIRPETLIKNLTNPELFVEGGENLLDDDGVERLELTRDPHLLVNSVHNI